MAFKVAELFADLKLRDTSFNKTLNTSRARLGRLATRIGTVVKQLGVLAAAAIAAGVALATMLVKRSLEAIDSLAKMARFLGRTADELMRVKWAATLAGASFQEVEVGMRRFAVVLGDAKNGIGDGVDLWKKWGNVIGDDVYEGLKVVAKELEGMSDIDKATLAYKLFGRSGVSMLNMLGQGVEEYTRALGEAKAAGYGLTEGAARGVEDANDAIARLKMQFEALVNIFTVWLAPVIDHIAQGLQGLLTDQEAFTTSLNSFKGTLKEMLQTVYSFFGFFRFYGGVLKLGGLGWLEFFTLAATGVETLIKQVLRLIDLIPGIKMPDWATVYYSPHLAEATWERIKETANELNNISLSETFGGKLINSLAGAVDLLGTGAGTGKQRGFRPDYGAAMDKVQMAAGAASRGASAQFATADAQWKRLSANADAQAGRDRARDEILERIANRIRANAVPIRRPTRGSALLVR